MKSNFDDEKLTAYALGELPPADARELEKKISGSSAAHEFVAETKQVAAQLRADFRAELEVAQNKPRNVLPLPAPQSFWSDSRWGSIGVAAAIAVAALVLVFAILERHARNPISARNRPTLPPAEIEMEFPAGEISGATGAEGANGFVEVAKNPISFFPTTAGTASYAEVAREIHAGKIPPKDSVKIEELINYFSYDDPTPRNGDALSINLEAANCPWQGGHDLVRIALCAGAPARSVRARVKFDPARIRAYRLLGYDGKNPAGEISPSDFAAGNAVTALYEIVPTEQRLAEATLELLNVEVSYRPIKDGGERTVDQSLGQRVGTFRAASADFKFAAAVVEFGMILRQESVGKMAQVLELARGAEGRDEDGKRRRFFELAREAEALGIGKI